MLLWEDAAIFTTLKTMLTVQFCFAHYSIVLCPLFIRIMPIMRMCYTQSKIEFFGGYEFDEWHRFGTANAIISFFGINLQTFFYFGRFTNEFETLMFY